MLQDQIETCLQNYKRWKEKSLSSADVSETRRAASKAFFWSEMGSAFIILSAIEKSNAKNPELKRKIIVAKANLSKKLADYAERILSEIKLSGE